MTNSNTPFGLKPIQNKGGEIKTSLYYVPSSYGTALFIGDPVIITGTSNTTNTIGGKSFPAGSLPEINKVAAGNPIVVDKIVGSIVGFLPNFDNTSRAYNPASTEAIAIVADDPAQVFEIQEETAGTPLAATSVGLNANITFSESGSTVTGISGAELDTFSPDTNGTYQLKILGLVDRVDNAIGQHAKWNVKINNHQYANIVTGI